MAARQRFQDRRAAGGAQEGTVFPFYGSDIKLQTRFILENLKGTFEAAGSSLDNVFKAQVFLTDLNLLPCLRLCVEALLVTAPTDNLVGTRACWSRTR